MHKSHRTDTFDGHTQTKIFDANVKPKLADDRLLTRKFGTESTFKSNFSKQHDAHFTKIKTIRRSTIKSFH